MWTEYLNLKKRKFEIVKKFLRNEGFFPHDLTRYEELFFDFTRAETACRHDFWRNPIVVAPKFSVVWTADSKGNLFADEFPLTETEWFEK